MMQNITGPSIKSTIASIVCVLFLATEIQGSSYQYSFFLPTRRFNPYPWGSHVSWLDLFRQPTHSIRGMRRPTDTFWNRWQYATPYDSLVSRHRSSNCRHQSDVYQEQEMMKTFEQNPRDSMTNHRNSDGNFRGGGYHCTSNNPRRHEYSSHKDHNPQSLVDKQKISKPQESNEKRNSPDKSYSEKESNYRKHPKMESPLEEINQQRRFSSPRQPIKMKEIANLDVSGYYPDEITIEVKNNGQLIIEGVRVCDCEESCFEKEFQRRVALPKGTHVQSLRAVFTLESDLRILGYQSQDGSTSGLKTPFNVSIETDGNLWKPKKRNSDPTCGGQKRGIKLKQMKSNRRRTVEDHPDVRPEKQFEGEINEDGVTIETDEY